MKVRRNNLRRLNPDIKYNDYTVQRLIHYVMRQGKKTIAEKIVYKAIEILKSDDTVAKDLQVIDIIKKLMGNIKPVVYVVPKRIRGATYPVPCEIKPKQAEMLGLKWLIDGAHKREGMNMDAALAKEMIDAYNGVGYAFKQREQTHASAKSNRAFAHLGSAR
jgi:small subunit ribosomal protein S7